MHYRRGEPNSALCSGRLSQQYEVNCYSCVEANKLSFYFSMKICFVVRPTKVYPMQYVVEHQQEEMLASRGCYLPVILEVRDICNRIFMIAWLFVVYMVHQTSSLLLLAIPSGLKLPKRSGLSQVRNLVTEPTW
jgi:hypothetical protein